MQAAGLAGQVFWVGCCLFLFCSFLFPADPAATKTRQGVSLVENLKRGDQVITSGGIKGKVSKASEGAETISVEIAKGVEVEIIRGMVAEVRDKDGNLASAKK